MKTGRTPDLQRFLLRLEDKGVLVDLNISANAADRLHDDLTIYRTERGGRVPPDEPSLITGESPI